jgi:hypothetical protein
MIVLDTPKTIACKRNYYLQIMEKAKQIGDQTLVRMILKKLAYLGINITGSISAGYTVFPISTIHALSGTIDHKAKMPDFLTSIWDRSDEKMIKKLLIFYSLFALVIIGGSLILSLWFIPKYFVYSDHFPKDISGMIQPEPEKDIASSDHRSQNEINKSRRLITTQMTIGIGAICIALLVGLWLKKRYIQTKPLTVPGYIFKITRLTDHSEYDVFCKAAEDWPVSKQQIEQDFKRFMSEERVPYYVNDFIRKNKKHIDEIPTSIYQFNGFD